MRTEDNLPHSVSIIISSCTQMLNIVTLSEAGFLKKVNSLEGEEWERRGEGNISSELPEDIIAGKG